MQKASLRSSRRAVKMVKMIVRVRNAILQLYYHYIKRPLVDIRYRIKKCEYGDVPFY